jgi:tRNA uridine 5-carboxymethylaminomethyl modification enzyme
MRDWQELLDISKCSDKLNLDKSAFDILSVVSYDVWPSKLTDCDSRYSQLAAKRSLLERVKVEALYERNVAEQRAEMHEIKRDEELEIPFDLDYAHSSLNLSNEEREKLLRCRPGSVGAASRIPGVTPNAVLSLLRFVKKMPKTAPLGPNDEALKSQNQVVQ